MKPTDLSADAYATVRALQWFGKWKRTLVKPNVQRELRSCGLVTIEPFHLEITEAGMSVPRIPRPNEEVTWL